jgi:hypothetical protein
MRCFSVLPVFAVVCVVLAFTWAGHSFGRDSDLAHSAHETVLHGDASPQRVQYSEGELDAFLRGDVKIESYYCGCNDVPKKHFPYTLAIVKAPHGELLVRAEGVDGVVKYTALAIRHGDVYCDVAAEGGCFGSFESLCDFTDFRYGRFLAAFFPTCKKD